MFLSEEISGSAPPLTSLEWGKELFRLSSAPELTYSIDKDGKPEDFPSLEGFAMPSPAEGRVSLSGRLTQRLLSRLRYRGCSHTKYRNARDKVPSILASLFLVTRQVASMPLAKLVERP